MVTLLYQAGVTDSIVYFSFKLAFLQTGRRSCQINSSDDEVVVRARDIVRQRPYPMDSSEAEGVVVKVPSFNSSDEEVTDRKKIAVIESDGDDRWFKKILVIRRRKWMRNRRTMQDKARRGRGTSTRRP